MDIQGNNNSGNQQGLGPYGYPVDPYIQQQGQMSQNYQPNQQPQVVTGPTPEIPTRVEGGEQQIVPEVKPVLEKAEEKKEAMAHKVEQKKDETGKDKEIVPDEQKFESPFKVYGYNVSQDIAAQGQRSAGTNVKGDTSFAKTWLIVLLGRLLRMRPNEVLEAT